MLFSFGHVTSVYKLGQFSPSELI